MGIQDRNYLSFTVIGKGVLGLLQVKYMTAQNPKIVIRIAKEDAS